MSDPSPSEPSRDALPAGTRVDCYCIRSLLGSGGFSLIYLAEDEETHEEVVIKEFFPKKFGFRGSDLSVTARQDVESGQFNRGRRLFYQEAKVLASLRHPHIVRVINFFLANNTAYLAMEYQRGRNLGEYVRERGGGMSTTFIMTVFPPILDALALIHQRSLLHLDIKPGNIHLRPGGSPILLDFGAAHSLNPDDHRQQAQVITAGFSPLEQYLPDGVIGPWTDVYAIGATMRTCIAGRPPASAIERHASDRMRPATEQFRRGYPAHLLAAIDWALQMDPRDRPQNAGELLVALKVERRIIDPGPLPGSGFTIGSSGR
ncbi:Serine/threonine protein kinase [Gammaproteobacteria bacterium]